MIDPNSAIAKTKEFLHSHPTPPEPFTVCVTPELPDQRCPGICGDTGKRCSAFQPRPINN